MNSNRMQRQDWEKMAKEANFQPQVMAALCTMSLRQLERFFKRDLKRTPRQWVRDLRCRLALELISTGWSSKAVAAELHYWDESHFCHEFKRVYGASPQNFAPAYGDNEGSRVKTNVALLPGRRAFTNPEACTTQSTRYTTPVTMDGDNQ